ncbi:glycoside hydrolase family 92 protein [Vibrio parahaemolyticus]|uniref:GH92 family glycosyl hydrolase n=1 Tax=Vibrio parahaemolyticus TaxID=670 RepID=UPI00100E1011|nr:GH92 family glycosyl hydrolase [Vibrio parahaemolyticus]RXQ04460.1 glycoside hydrolase family 92 protein [Vibrio parahaemolyticus]
MKLKRTLISTAILAAMFGLAGCNSDDDNSKSGTPSLDTTLTQYVNPLIGTGADGHTFPGAVVPYGLVQLSPDTEMEGWGSAAGYFDHGKLTEIPVYGFSHTHLSGTGITDLGDILVLPFTKKENAVFNTFDKDNETAEAGYYAVELNKGEIKAELTTTQRVGFHRYTFKEGTTPHIKFDLDHTLNKGHFNNRTMKGDLEFIDAYTIRGLRSSNGWANNQHVYFYATFNQPIVKAIALVDGTETEIDVNNDNIDAVKTIAYLEFAPSSTPLEIQVGLSPTGTEGAEKNLEAEAKDVSFDTARAQANDAWHQELSRMMVSGGTEDQKEIFYTALYHTKIAPMVHQDVDGRFRGMGKGSIREGEGEYSIAYGQATEEQPNFSVYSLWDTQRALHPLKTITEPTRAVQYAKNLVQKYTESGLLPKWEHLGDETGTMVGYPAVAVIADAITKFPEEFTQQEKELALKAAIDSSTYENYPALQADWDQGVLDRTLTKHIDYIEKNGFTPAIQRVDGEPVFEDYMVESVSYGLENAFYDWAIAQIAKAAGDTKAEEQYLERSKGYKKYFDYNPTEYAEHGVTGFMRPVMIDETFMTPFDPYGTEHETGNYTEGNAWQWTWFVPHDIAGLKTIMGGDAEFQKNLEATFTAESQGTETPDMSGLIGQVAFGNEPSHHIPYLFNWTAEPWKTQQVVDHILDDMYFAAPEGVIGNEDVGAMSAWYVMSALGFYQVNAAEPTYTVGRPLFDKAVIPVKGGTFTITTENNADDNMYIKSVTINGKALDNGFFFDHSEFKPGGELHFVMTGEQSEAMKAPQ